MLTALHDEEHKWVGATRRWFIQKPFSLVVSCISRLKPCIGRHYGEMDVELRRIRVWILTSFEARVNGQIVEVTKARTGNFETTRTSRTSIESCSTWSRVGRAWRSTVLTVLWMFVIKYCEKNYCWITVNVKNVWISWADEKIKTVS